MLQWIQDHSDVLNVVANFVMVGVWIVYLHLFWKSFRRQLRANVLISRGAGSGLNARCLISNMSKEAVFIEGVILVLEQGEQRWSTAISNIMGISDEQAREAGAPALHEGPLAAGASMDIGRFQQLLDKARETVRGAIKCAEPPNFDAFEIWVIADYSAENRLVFIRRRFGFGMRGDVWTLRPEKLKTETIRSGRHRRQIEKMLEGQLEGISS